jgi:hypothetical protein
MASLLAVFLLSQSVAAPFSKKRQSCRAERPLDLSRALYSLLIATARTPFSPGSTPGLAAAALPRDRTQQQLMQRRRQCRPKDENSKNTKEERLEATGRRAGTLSQTPKTIRRAPPGLAYGLPEVTDQLEIGYA